MKDIPDKNPSTRDIRQLAEDKLKTELSQSYPVLSEADVMKLVHELEVHRIELEMQNEELLADQLEIQRANDFYDYAPAGYFTLSPEGRIIKLNLSAASMLGKERDVLIESLLEVFVMDESKPIFKGFLKQIFLIKETVSCEIKLLTNRDKPLYIQLTGKLSKLEDQCQVTAVDITERKLNEELLNQERELYLDMVNNQPAGIYRIRVIPKDKWWKDAWSSSANPPYQMDLASDRFCEILKITREEFRESPGIIIDLIHPEDKADFVSKNEEANNSILRFNWEGRLVVGGNIIWIHLESIPRQVVDGDIVWTGILYDITNQKQNEKDLKESEAKYRELVDNSPDAICIYSEGKIEFVNIECLRLMKAGNKEELLGRDVLEFIHPDSLSIAVERMTNVLRNGNIQPLEEEKFLRLDGSSIDVEVKSMPVLYQDKKAIQLIIQDISDRKSVENEILKSREDFKELFEYAPVGYHEIDNFGRIVRMNQTELDMLGYTREEIMGQYVWKLFENEAHSQRRTKEKLEGKLISTEPYERKIFTKDKSTITVLLQDKIIKSKDGTILGTRSSVQDIHERKQVELNLQSSEEKFRQVFENSIIGKSMTSIDGKMQVNKAFSQITGYTGEELSLMKWSEITHPEDIEINKNEIKSILQGEKEFSNWEKRYIHKNGNIVWADISIFLLRDKEEKPLHFITEIYDITDRKQAETDLRFSEEKFKKAFMTSPDSININRLKDGMYVSINNGFTRTTGYYEEEVLGKTSKEINIWKNQADRQKMVKELQEKGIVDNIMAQFISKSGVIVYGMMSATMIELEGCDHVLSITRDITALRMTDLALKQSEERFKVLFEDAPDTMFLADPETGEIIDANAAACRLFKKNKHELIGTYQCELHPVVKTGFSIDTSKKHILQSTMPEITLPVEDTIICSDGSEIPVEILAQTIRIDGKAFILGTFRDITERKKSEQALRESEDLYRNLVLRIPDGVYKSTPGGKFIDVNPAMVEMLGYNSKEELMAIDIKSQLYFDTSDRDYIVLNSLNEELAIYPLKKQDGSELWIEDHGWYNKNPEGEIVSHEGVLRDITDRKQVEEALHESEDKYRTMIENSNDLIWALDKQGCFTFANGMALEITDFKQEDWIGKSFASLVFKEDLSFVTDVFDRTMTGENCTCEIRLKKADESILILSVNTSPIYISGKIEGMVSFGQDITESKKAFGLLQESEEKFRSITEQTTDLISITDNQGKLIYASTASKSLFQYEPEEMCGLSFSDFVFEESIEKAEATFRKIIESKESISNLEFLMKRKDGSLFYGELNGSSFKYGSNYGTLVVIRDMTERKKAQEEIEQKMNELVRFHNLTVDREMTMIELKKEINELLNKSGEKEKYKIVN